MNVNDPLFNDLALKVIAGRASEAERSELAARIAGHPELEAELESLREDVAFAKEVLPLLGDEQVKAGELPGYARARLRAAVKQNLGNPESSKLTWNTTLVRQWRWWLGLGTAAAVGLIVVSLNWPRPTNNLAIDVHPKPVVQLAMLDSMGPTRASAPQSNLELAATLKETLQQTNLMSFSEAANLEKWVSEWPSDTEQPVFKVWYDRDAGEVRVLGRWRGKPQIEKSIPVASERNLPAALRAAREAAEHVVKQVVKP
jgi:hypothetical protein